MKELFIRIKVDAEGSVRSLEHFSRDQIVRELMRPRRMRNSAFSIEIDDAGDVLLLKRAVEAVGGVRQLAYELNVSRETLYNWKSKSHVPGDYRAYVERLAARLGDVMEDEE